MAYSAKNYTEPGGEKTVIGGTLEFTSGAKVHNLPTASKTNVGGVKAVDDLEKCEATDVAGINDYINTHILISLRSAGILK